MSIPRLRWRHSGLVGPSARRAAPGLAATLAVILSVVVPPPAHGQELELKRDLPGAEMGPCPPDTDRPMRPFSRDRDEAERLRSAAIAAEIVGDLVQARDLLSRASLLDPTSPDVAYRLGRTLERLGESGAAVAQYCRFILLDPSAEELAEARARIAELSSLGPSSLPVIAAREFRTGLERFDAGELQEAERAFTAALVEAPDLAEGYYNRGVVFAAMGRPQPAVRDLRTYLALSPGADDEAEVLAWIQAQPADFTELEIPVEARTEADRRASSGLSPGGALARGLVVPGLGQFYTGQPLLGASYLGAAAGAIAFGLAYTEVDVKCLGPAVEGECPPEDILEEASTRPYLWPAVGVGVAVGVVGAIQAYRRAKALNEGRLTGVTTDGPALVVRGSRILPPSVSATAEQVELSLVRVRF